MDADVCTARGPVVRHRAWPHRALAVLVLIAAPAAVAGPDHASDRAPVAAAGDVAKSAAGPHGWYDGRTWRPLTLDPTLRADRSGAAAGKSLVLRAAGGPRVDAAGDTTVVLRDDTGRARALPGGVLVVLAQPLPEAAARALLQRHGLVSVRPVADRLWHVAAEPGLASLALANRLATSGDFAAAQPDWWIERTRK